MRGYYATWDVSHATRIGITQTYSHSQKISANSLDDAKRNIMLIVNADTNMQQATDSAYSPSNPQWEIEWSEIKKPSSSDRQFLCTLHSKRYPSLLDEDATKGACVCLYWNVRSLPIPQEDLETIIDEISECPLQYPDDSFPNRYLIEDALEEDFFTILGRGETDEDNVRIYETRFLDCMHEHGLIPVIVKKGVNKRENMYDHVTIIFDLVDLPI